MTEAGVKRLREAADKVWQVAENARELSQRDRDELKEISSELHDRARRLRGRKA